MRYRNIRVSGSSCVRSSTTHADCSRPFSMIIVAVIVTHRGATAYIRPKFISGVSLGSREQMHLVCRTQRERETGRGASKRRRRRRLRDIGRLKKITLACVAEPSCRDGARERKAHCVYEETLFFYALFVPLGGGGDAEEARGPMITSAASRLTSVCAKCKFASGTRREVLLKGVFRKGVFWKYSRRITRNNTFPEFFGEKRNTE